MRLVEKIEEVEEQMKMAMSEAKSAFGDDAVFIEKFAGRRQAGTPPIRSDRQERTRLSGQPCILGKGSGDVRGPAAEEMVRSAS